MERVHDGGLEVLEAEKVASPRKRSGDVHRCRRLDMFSKLGEVARRANRCHKAKNYGCQPKCDCDDGKEIQSLKNTSEIHVAKCLRQAECEHHEGSEQNHHWLRRG